MTPKRLHGMAYVTTYQTQARAHEHMARLLADHFGAVVYARQRGAFAPVFEVWRTHNRGL